MEKRSHYDYSGDLPKRRLKIGIKPQLIILVCSSSLLSLLILAVVSGVYYSYNLSAVRAERLEVISQLKTSQIKQSIDTLLYQIYFVSTKDTLYTPLVSNRAGNNSANVFQEAQNTLDQFLQASETFALARLYNLNLEVMADSYNNLTNLPTPVIDYLYPLQQNASMPQALLDGTSISELGIPTYFTGPIANDLSLSVTMQSFFMGITIPVYANTSILLNAPSIAGYLSVISSSSSVQLSLNDSSTSVDYTVVLVKPIYSTTGYNNSAIDGYETVFPVADYSFLPDTIYPLSSSNMVQTAFTKLNGYAEKANSFDMLYSIGFTQFELTKDIWWSVIVEQPRAVFLAPINKLRNIIIGVVIGIGVFMCLLTFPLAVWFVRPVSKLKEATEAITMSKKQGLAAVAAAKAKDNGSGSLPGSGIGSAHEKSPSPYGGTSTSVRTHPSNLNRLAKHNSHTSAENSLYSYGIFLPGRIPPTKKFFKDEFLELSDAFNIMTEELEKQYMHLEDRVKLRTKELELLKIEAELANEAKTVFIANISHELRTPLNGILGMTSIAMDEQDPSRIQDSLKLIHRSGELLLHILTELLTYSKNTLNRSKLEKLNFQVLEIVYQVQSIFLKLAIDQRVNLKISLMPNTIRRMMLYGDSNRIIQIVMNLVSNSLKFTPVDGSVGVTFKLLGEYDYNKSKTFQHKEVFIKRHKGNKNIYNPSLVKNDRSSIHTLESKEYERLVSKSFSDENKPLPELPENARNLLDFTDTESIETTTKPAPRMLDDESIKNLHKNYFEKTESYSSKREDLEINMNNKAYTIKRLTTPKSWAIQIQVVDTGPGIEPALQEKVFEPFIQGDQTLSRSYGGTGLGLSICRQLASMMNGTLTLESEVGVGSTFTFTVPLPQTHEIVVPASDRKEFYEDEFNPESKVNRKVAFDENIKTDTPKRHKNTNNNDDVLKSLEPPSSIHKNLSVSSSSLEVPSFEKPHLVTKSSTGTANSAKLGSESSHDITIERIGELNVLVAEDNMVNQEVIKRMLKLEGLVNITMACNGLEALEQVQASIMQDTPFDLVFMDIQMPKVDGLLATKRIRNELHYSGPIIALTAFADESNVKECLNSGMSGFLSKPIKRANLRKKILEFSVLGADGCLSSNSDGSPPTPTPGVSNDPFSNNHSTGDKNSPLSAKGRTKHAVKKDYLVDTTIHTNDTSPIDPFSDPHQHHHLKNFQPLPPVPRKQNGLPMSKPSSPPHTPNSHSHN